MFVRTYLSLSTGFNVGRVWLEVTTPTAGIESASDTLRAMLLTNSQNSTTISMRWSLLLCEKKGDGRRQEFWVEKF